MTGHTGMPESRMPGNLARIASGSRVHHGYLLEGPAHQDKLAVAKAFAQALLCPQMPGVGCGVCGVCHKIQHENHIDCTFVGATKAENSKVFSVKDDGIDNLIVRLGKKPYEGDRNIGIVESAETMTPRACNRLLKTLEEPPLGTVIILLCDNALSLPATIRSRCLTIRLTESLEEGPGDWIREAEELIALLVSQAPFYKCKEAVDQLKLDKEKALAFLDAMEAQYGALLRGTGDRHELFRREALCRAVSAVETAKKDIKGNISVRYALMNLILRIGG